jgi:hypothetical protein
MGEVMSGVKETVCQTNEAKCSDGNSRKESELKFQSPRPFERPKWMKSFKQKMTGSKTPSKPETNVDACDFEALGKNVTIPDSKKKMYVNLDEVKFTSVEVSTNVDACNYEELGRPEFPAELSRNIKKTIVLEDIKLTPIVTDTNVGKCEEICAVIDDSKKVSLDKYYNDAVKDFDVFQQDIKVDAGNKDLCKILDV